MLQKQSEAVKVTASVVSSVLLALLVAAVIAYFFGWFTRWSVLPWTHLAFQVLTYELPITIFASLISILTYRFISRPEPDTESRCRKCGYILKGISKPECSECGEVI